MQSIGTLLDRIAQHVGGPRVLALPFIRVLAVFSGYAWVALSPEAFVGWDPVDTTMLAFLLYSVVVVGLIWLRPETMLRLNFLVLVVDLLFALLLVRLTGGAHSALFLALLLIVGLQAYYYGIRQGVLVALGTAAAYLALVWPTNIPVEWANTATRLAVLLGTSIGMGLIAEVETARRRRVRELSAEVEERERFIRSVLESLREGVVVLDPAGRVIAWNDAMEQRYGVSAAEVLGRPFFDCFPIAAREPWGESLQRLLRGEIPAFGLEAVEHESLRKGRVVLNLKGGLVRRAGQLAGIVLLVEDITERIALQHAAQQTEKLAALGTLAAGLAHELNNPIGIISSRIELMLLEADPTVLPPWMRDDLGVLHRHAQRVARVVQGLLSFARMSGGARKPLNLNDVVDETLLLMEKQVAKEGIALQRRLASRLPLIRGDATALQQVVMNLVINARDAMTEGGEIVVETDLDSVGGSVRLIVRDSGPGIPPEVLPRIFDPFFTTKPSGTGLGLSISYGIVQDHGGMLDVQSRPGEGTTFILAFPAAAVEVSA